jgi:type I restriction enzyme S subunit
MIPKDWDFIPLEQLALVERGKFTARPRNDPRYYGGSIPFVQTGDVASANGLLQSYSQTLNQEGLSVSKLFPKGSILVTIAATIGEVAMTSIDVACPDSIVVVQAKSGVCREWLKYALIARKPAMETAATQNAQKNINLQVLRPLLISTPPLEEQRKIAQILGTWDSAIALTENLIAAKQKRKEFLLDYLLSKNAHNEWRKLKLAELSTKPISYGIVQTGEPVKRGIPCVRVVDLTARELKPQKMITTCEEISQSYKKTILEKGELMIALRGEIGLVRLVDEKLVGCNLTRGIARVSPDKRLVLPEYLLWAIRSPLFRNNLLRRVNGSALQEIPITELRKVIVPVPPIERQQVIANLLDTADYEIEIIQNLFNFLQIQKRGLMQKLLTGEWRVKIEKAGQQLTEPKT